MIFTENIYSCLSGVSSVPYLHRGIGNQLVLHPVSLSVASPGGEVDHASWVIGHPVFLSVVSPVLHGGRVSHAEQGHGHVRQPRVHKACPAP